MIRAILIAIFFISAVVGVFFAVEHNKANGLYANVELEPAAVGALSIMPPPPVTAELDATGTITYYPNNAGARIPYIVFKDERNHTETKALAFNNTSTCLTPSGNYPCSLIGDALDTYYAGHMIRVRGTTEAEHVIVETLSTAS